MGIGQMIKVHQFQSQNAPSKKREIAIRDLMIHSVIFCECCEKSHNERIICRGCLRLMREVHRVSKNQKSFQFCDEILAQKKKKCAVCKFFPKFLRFKIFQKKE